MKVNEDKKKIRWRRMEDRRGRQREDKEGAEILKCEKEKERDLVDD